MLNPHTSEFGCWYYVMPKEERNHLLITCNHHESEYTSHVGEYVVEANPLICPLRQSHVSYLLHIALSNE